MDGFQDPYWNVIQTLAWVYLDDRALVRRASDDVTEHGTFSQELRLPDGRKELVETPSKPLGPRKLELIAAYRGGGTYPRLDDAKSDVLAAVRDGRLHIWGLENGEGDLKEIPQIQWADLKIDYERSRAGPSEYLRRGATEWHKLKFKRCEVLAVWPDPLERTADAASSRAHVETTKLVARLRKWIEKTASTKDPKTTIKRYFLEEARTSQNFRNENITDNMFNDAWRAADIPADFKKRGRRPGRSN